MYIAERGHAAPEPSPLRNGVIVLGMHRSGTSCLTGSLQARGLHLGDVQEVNPHNRKGNRESLSIMRLNDAVLAHSDGAWDRPPTRLSWTEEQAAERDAIIQQLSTTSPDAWGFKDPRTVLTLAFWKQALPAARLVGSFRHPDQVARSLHKRSRFAPQQGYELWRAYNAIILREHAAAPFPLVSFDLDPVDYRQSVDRVAEGLGLAAGPRDGDFFEAELRTQGVPEPTSSAMPADALVMYHALQRAAGLCTP